MSQPIPHTHTHTHRWMRSKSLTHTDVSKGSTGSYIHSGMHWKRGENPRDPRSSCRNTAHIPVHTTELAQFACHRCVWQATPERNHEPFHTHTHTHTHTHRGTHWWYTLHPEWQALTLAQKRRKSAHVISGRALRAHIPESRDAPRTDGRIDPHLRYYCWRLWSWSRSEWHDSH